MKENLPTKVKHSSYLYLNRVQMSFLAFLKCVPRQTTNVLFSFLLGIIYKELCAKIWLECRGTTKNRYKEAVLTASGVIFIPGPERKRPEIRTSGCFKTGRNFLQWIRLIQGDLTGRQPEKTDITSLLSCPLVSWDAFSLVQPNKSQRTRDTLLLPLQAKRRLQ